MEQTFTTGQVAMLTMVAPRTVRNWIDSGRLARVPGTGVRRVARSELVRFLEEHGMPLGPLADGGDPAEMARTVREAVEDVGVPLHFVLHNGRSVEVRGRVEFSVSLRSVCVIRVEDWHGRGTLRSGEAEIPLEQIADVEHLPE